MQPNTLFIVVENNDRIKSIVDKIGDGLNITVLEVKDIKKVGYYLTKHHIGVIVSIMNERETDPICWDISKFGSNYNKMWIHFRVEDAEKLPKETIINHCMNCYMSTILNNVSNKNVISVFTSCYKSGDLIYRPYNSLLRQTYRDWEFIIVDDSQDDEIGRQTAKILQEIAENDPRVKLFKYYKHSGFIGEVKNFASKLCSGYVTVEFDHDDEFADDLLERLHKVYKSDENIGFVYCDTCELYDNGQNFMYGENFAFGYGSYVNALHNGVWRFQTQTQCMNPTMLHDIVGVPNHVRSWRSTVLNKIGYYNAKLYAADDYELLLRTWMETKMVRIPYMGYFQYRNSNIGNNTFHRLGDIRNLQWILSNQYNNDRRKRLKDNFGIENYEFKNAIIWEEPWDFKEIRLTELWYDIGKVTIVITVRNNETLLIRSLNDIFNQTFKNYEIIIIGDKCPTLDGTMEYFKLPNIRWYNFLKLYDDNMVTPYNYALRCCLRTDLIAYYDLNRSWKPDHLEKLVNVLSKDKECMIASEKHFHFNSFVHRKDLLDKYGYFKKIDNFKEDFYSRWSSEKCIYVE